MPVEDLIRQLGISEQTYYRWKKQYAGLESNQVRELKQLQDENARLKKLVAEFSLDKAILQDIATKKRPNPSGPEQPAPCRRAFERQSTVRAQPLTRRSAKHAFEVPAQMALIEEAHLRRDDRRSQAASQQPLCMPHAH
ncbi:transposase IS3/IS911 family protein [Burkholderia sp. H160]|nr:transposase IS3/IS911 family protein [Burkholderia sp. H160]